MWLYEFQHVHGDGTSNFGVGHGFEIPYVFGTLDLFSLFRDMLLPADYEVSTGTQAAWARFADVGAVDDAVLGATWPRYESASTQYLAIDQPASVDDSFRSGRCAALRDLGLV